MICSFEQLEKIVSNGYIERVREGAINGASIDLHLGVEIIIECNSRSAVIDYRRRDPLPGRRVVMDAEEGYILQPGEFILAQSVERFNLPLWLSAEYKLKSSMARIGLDHANAGWADAGWHGSVLTLELKNQTRESPIRIRSGDAIGQMIFYQHAPVPDEASYKARGRYNGDLTVSGIKE
jgi:dCTP deaminase